MGDAALARQIGRRLRERRMALGMTTEALAHNAGISKSALEEQEAGRTRLPAESLLALAEAMSVPLRHLFEMRAAPTPESPPPPANAMDGQARALLNAYGRISHPDLRRAALVSVEALARLP